MSGRGLCVRLITRPGVLPTVMCPMSVIAKTLKEKAVDLDSGRSITGEQAHCNILMITSFRDITPCNFVDIQQVLWLRCCATNRKVTGSIPSCVSGFFIGIKYFRSHYGPGVDSASNRNEYQESFLGVKAAGA